MPLDEVFQSLRLDVGSAESSVILNPMNSSQERQEVTKGRTSSVYRETIGTVVNITNAGFVVVKFENSPVDSVILEFELDDLQFYTGTKFFVEFLKSFNWNGLFVLKSGRCCSTSYRSPTLHPRALKIYQDFPHGRIYINDQIRVEIDRKTSLFHTTYLNHLQEAIFVGAEENGNVTFQSFLQFRDRILNFTKYKPLPPPETRDTLMLKTEDEMRYTVYVAPSVRDKTLQRIIITKFIYARNQICANFVDFGNEELLNIADIYDAKEIDSNFARFPPLLLKCHLKGIVHLDVSVCSDKLKDKVVNIQLSETLYDVEDASIIPDINVFVMGSDGKQFLLNQAIVNEGFAVPEITKDQVGLFDQATPVSCSF